MEGGVLGDLVTALSEAGNSIPSVLLLGLATSVDNLRAILPDVAARLRPTVFRLTSAVDCLDDFQKEVFLGGLPHLMVNPPKLALRKRSLTPKSLILNSEP